MAKKLILVTFSSIYTLFLLAQPQLTLSGSTVDVLVYNVLTFGANPNGSTDSSKHLFDAWSSACNEEAPVMIVIPKGRYLVHPITFHGGDCKNTNRITFYLIGTLVGPLDFRLLGKAPAWLDFQWATNVSIVGGGTLDARGPALWACKRKGGVNNDCPDGATTLSFTNSENIIIKGITSLNSQMFHIVINGCKTVKIEGVKIRAAGNSPNTDGIHVQFSSPIAILNTAIKTGDDCISIGPGTKNLLIDHIACGPGHGISIGSLAKEDEEEGVENVIVKTVVFMYSTNGLRIKSWGRPSTAYVRGILFQDVLMRNVANPIIIDQNYCPYNKNCPGQESGAKVSDVKYRGIRGTSTTKVAVKFDCSAKEPCTGITLENVNLTYYNNNQPAVSFCSNVLGKSLGFVQPKTCL